MAKAKKPTSTGVNPADKSEDSTAKSSGSVPKTARAKPTGTPSSAPKAAVSEKAAVTSSDPVKETEKTTAAEPSTPAKVDAKPVDSKPTEKPAPITSKIPEATKVEEKPIPKATEVPQKSGSIFWPLLIGGALAATLGFLAAEMNVLGTRGDTADLRAALQEQKVQIAALENAEPQMPDIEMPDLGPLTNEVTSLSETLSAIDARLTEVEKRPITGGSSTAAVAAYERELEALQASVKEQRTEIEGLLNNALSVEEATANAARKTMLQAALTRITVAINSGQPFADALTDLDANGLNDIPAALTDTAETGVVTLGNLQARFPDTARAVLATARATGTDDASGGMASFLKRQLGARSVEPREGTDTDAVLSRAEAAVRDGRLADALTELDALSEISQSDLDAWLSDARARQASEAAIQDLSQRLTAN